MKYNDEFIERVADLYLRIKEHNELPEKTFEIAAHKTFERFLQFMSEARA